MENVENIEVSESIRKLASIRKISKIIPIQGADRIELVQIGMWKVITKKNEFKVNDKVIFFEIDSFIPYNCYDGKLLKYIEFLKDRCNKTFQNTEGVLIKSLKLRGEYSQGFVIPVLDEFKDFEYDTNLTEILGILKYELPTFKENSRLGIIRQEDKFPYFIRKTDCERIQNIKLRDFVRFWNKKFEVTLKYDGTSFTNYIKDGICGICSRNYQLKSDSDNVYNKMNINETLEKYYSKFNRNIAIQGEIVGPQIQGNPHKLSNLNYKIFNIFDIDNQEYCTFDDRTKIISELQEINKNIEHVDKIQMENIVSGMRFIDIIDENISEKDFNELSNENKEKLLFDCLEKFLVIVTKNLGKNLEGIVLKSFDGKEIIKVISNDYIL